MGKRFLSSVSISLREQILCFTAACIAAVFFAVNPVAALELITPAEAALPPGTAPSFTERGSPTRLPSITILSPAGVGAVYSPLDFKLRFSAFGGAAIDPDSVAVAYIKQPDIDITARIKSFITAEGIDITRAEMPPGLHQFWIELKDTDGRVSAREFEFQVVK
jgi:hypothetical protein